MSLLDRLAEGLFGIKKPRGQYVKTPARPVIIRHEKEEANSKKTNSVKENPVIENYSNEDLVKENTLKEDLDSTMAEMNEMINKLQDSLTETINKSNDEHSEELQNKLDEELNALRNDIGKSFSSLEDKIHSENVKTYRNIQALVNELDKKTAKEAIIDVRFAGIKRLLGITTWVTIGTFLVLAVFILHSLGVF